MYIRESDAAQECFSASAGVKIQTRNINNKINYDMVDSYPACKVDIGSLVHATKTVSTTGSVMCLIRVWHSFLTDGDTFDVCLLFTCLNCETYRSEIMIFFHFHSKETLTMSSFVDFDTIPLMYIIYNFKITRFAIALIYFCSLLSTVPSSRDPWSF